MLQSGTVNRVLFPVTIFLSAFLLFQVQPIMGRFILPWFGGTPAVWSVCLLFFQAMLLAGYAYAHWLRRPRVHLLLLAISLAFLPVIPVRPAMTDTPSLRILLLLAATVGVPYFLLSATAPLLQKWSASERSPWRLYALSNFGSFLALLTYPFLVEPYVRLRTQAWVWSGIYVLFTLLCGWIAWSVGQAILSPVSKEVSPRPTLLTILYWLGLAAAGSTLLLATTNIVTQDIAVSPFLWIAPLSLYLLTFVLAFESDRWYPRLPFAVAAGVLAPVACAVVNAGIGVAIWIQLGIYMAALFVICMVCHGELRYSRPEPKQLTLFYLTIAAGGVLGGVFVALIAPRVFTEFNEYPIGLAAACLLGLAGWLRSGAWSQWTRSNFAIRIPIMALLLGGLSSTLTVTMSGAGKAAGTWRNFYGILRVTDLPDPTGAMRELTHGRIKHGSQYLEQAWRDRPISYYGPHSGVAMALNALPDGPRRIAVIGLGTGTMAAWGRPGDLVRFYEINPLVETIATTWFTFLPDSKAKTEIVLGDARIQMEREASLFDFIVVDAFSSDAIPMHLLTAEAADIYRQRLLPGGLLLFHISNRSLNLEPVIRGIAQHLNWNAAQILAEDNPATGEDGSRWVILTENLDLLQKIAQGAPHVGWTNPKRKPILWTDDFASLWHVLKW
jgi:hypothetical protein